MLGKAPQEIPDGLSPQEYYSLGTWYHEEGDIDKSREVLKRAISLDPAGETAYSARSFLAKNVPRNIIPEEAIKCIQQLTRNGQVQQDAAETLRQLTQSYPNFEWPLKHLADMHLKTGDTRNAIRLLQCLSDQL